MILVLHGLYQGLTSTYKYIRIDASTVGFRQGQIMVCRAFRSQSFNVSVDVADKAGCTCPYMG